MYCIIVMHVYLPPKLTNNFPSIHALPYEGIINHNWAAWKVYVLYLSVLRVCTILCLLLTCAVFNCLCWGHTDLFVCIKKYTPYIQFLLVWFKGTQFLLLFVKGVHITCLYKSLIVWFKDTQFLLFYVKGVQYSPYLSLLRVYSPYSFSFWCSPLCTLILNESATMYGSFSVGHYS